MTAEARRANAHIWFRVDKERKFDESGERPAQHPHSTTVISGRKSYELARVPMHTTFTRMSRSASRRDATIVQELVISDHERMTAKPKVNTLSKKSLRSAMFSMDTTQAWSLPALSSMNSLQILVLLLSTVSAISKPRNFAHYDCITSEDSDYCCTVAYRSFYAQKTVWGKTREPPIQSVEAEIRDLGSQCYFSCQELFPVLLKATAMTRKSTLPRSKVDTQPGFKMKCASGYILGYETVPSRRLPLRRAFPTLEEYAASVNRAAGSFSGERDVAEGMRALMSAETPQVRRCKCSKLFSGTTSWKAVSSEAEHVPTVEAIDPRNAKKGKVDETVDCVDLNVPAESNEFEGFVDLLVTPDMFTQSLDGAGSSDPTFWG